MNNKNNTEKMNKWLCWLAAKFLLMTALLDVLIGDSALLLYFSKSRTRSRNSIIVPISQNLSLFMSVFYCVSGKDFWVLWQW